MKNALDGLSSNEAAKQLKKFGYNRLPTEKPLNLLQIISSILKEPMLGLLLACGFLYLILGDPQEALLLLCFVFIIIGITIIQERKNERALAALRNLSTPKAHVIRDGKKQSISADLLVPKDIIILNEGDRIPADGLLLKAENFLTDESLLTGESVPVRKSLGDETKAKIFAGTMVVKGHGIAQISSTGINTEIGKIGQSLKNIVIVDSNIQIQSKDIIKKFSLFALFLCFLVLVILGLRDGAWLHGILAGLSLAMAILPEELPIVLTVFFAIGAWRIAQRQVLTKRMPAIETLGSISTLCVDKTGTLTMNHMEIKAMVCEQNITQIHNITQKICKEQQNLLRIGLLASPNESFDPIEKAIREMANYSLAEKQINNENLELKKEYPFNSHLTAISQAWWNKVDQQFEIYSKGSPEAIFELCKLNTDEKKRIIQWMEKMADQGLRIIAFAQAQTDHLPDEHLQVPFIFSGLIGMKDPIRPEVPQAIRECYQAGINIIMMTGDHPRTAQVIAREIGLKNTKRVITGPELDALSDEELQRQIKKTFIFARIRPEQKLRLVKSLQANKQIIGMTGDGINDAPALKAADIGIAMGKRGTEVARSAADLILLDDNFASIVATIKEGRRIYDNLKKAMTYILAVHVPIAGLAILPVLLGWPLLLLPIHIVMFEIIIDPICTIIFEKEPAEKNLMKRAPRPAKEKLFDYSILWQGLLLGLIIVIGGAWLYHNAQEKGLSVGSGRAMIVLSMLLGNLAMLLTIRARKRSILIDLWERNNNGIWLVIILVTILTFSINFFTPLQNIFKFEIIPQNFIVAAILLGLSPLLVGELLKLRFITKKF